MQITCVNILYASEISFGQFLCGLTFMFRHVLCLCYATDSMSSYVNKISSLCCLLFSTPNPSYSCVAKVFLHISTPYQFLCLCLCFGITYLSCVFWTPNKSSSLLYPIINELAMCCLLFPFPNQSACAYALLLLLGVLRSHILLCFQVTMLINACSSI